MKINFKILKSTNFLLTIIFVIGILISVNFISYKLSLRLDLTENKDFSISKISKNVVSKLDDIVNVKVYFSDDLPSRFITLKQEVGDILNEYENYSKRKIKVTYIDPSELEERDLYMLGIPALQFNILEKDKYQVVKGYLGMTIEQGDKKEVIPVVETTENFEYQITLAIKKVISSEFATVGFISAEEDYSSASEELSKIYDLRKIDIKNDSQSLLEIDTLVIAGQKEDLGEGALEAIDEFIMRGGKLLVLADGINVDQGLSTVINEIDLFGLLEKYGIKVNNDLVLDTKSGVATFNTGFFTISTNYPFWPKIEKSGFNKDEATVANLESLVLPWASSVALSGENDNLEKINLVKTSPKSWTEKDNIDLNPQQQFLNKNYTESVVAALFKGRVASAYSDKVSDAKLIVVGDSDYVRDSFLSQSPDNLVFFQNLVDSLSLDEDLINIRSKGMTERPVKELEENEKRFIRYLNVFGVTILVIGFGVARYYIRRKK